MQFVFLNENIIQENKELNQVLAPKTDSENEKAAVCIDLTCMLASFAPGVSESNNMVGFTVE